LIADEIKNHQSSALQSGRFNDKFLHTLMTNFWACGAVRKVEFWKNECIDTADQDKKESHFPL